MKSDNILSDNPNDQTFIFQLPLTAQTLTETMPSRPRQDIVDWLSTTPTGKFQYIFELGDLWGISFENEEDAIQFKLTWL
ncbi:MAG: hypothetical protein HC836_35565 [Richelia sp. RM2_1_2]|nr:hypothetical protein [Richelia sp. RM2_1_2]